jgi:hypothetical protein
MSKVSQLAINDEAFSQTMSNIARDIITFEINNSGFTQQALANINDVLIKAWEEIKNSETDIKIRKTKASLLLIAAHAYLVTNKQKVSKEELLDDIDWMYNLSL